MSLVSRISDLAEAVRDKLNAMTPRLLPAGGTTGQVLAKTSATDYAVSWQAGGGGSVTSENVRAAMIPAGDLPVRFDALQPEVDCLWVSPTGAIVLITESA